MSELKLDFDDEKIADALNNLVDGIENEIKGGGDDTVNFEDIPEYYVEESEKINIKGASEISINTDSVGKAITDGGDMRRLLSDLLENP